jgi:hypothetical protein
MRRAILLISSLLVTTPAWAAASAPSDGFAAFWKDFAAAARNQDKAKINALTKFPVEYRGKQLGPKQFDVVWKAMFPPNQLTCLAKAKPIKEYQGTGYNAFCNKIIYAFSREPEGWRFISTHPDD